MLIFFRLQRRIGLRPHGSGDEQKRKGQAEVNAIDINPKLFSTFTFKFHPSGIDDVLCLPIDKVIMRLGLREMHEIGVALKSGKRGTN